MCVFVQIYTNKVQNYKAIFLNKKIQTLCNVLI